MGAVTKTASQTGFKVLKKGAKCDFEAQIMKKWGLEHEFPMFSKKAGLRYLINNPVNTGHWNFKTK